MDTEDDRQRKANAALEAWVRDLLAENRILRERLARLEPVEDQPHHSPSVAA